MPRNLVLGNGRVMAGFDRRYLLRELYYPRVGMDNQVAGNRCCIGCWEGGNFSWLDQDCWEKRIDYLPRTLVGRLAATNRQQGLRWLINDGVHHRRDLFLRRLSVQNLNGEERHLRIFFTHDFSLQGSDVGDTALFDPETSGLLHYKRHLYLLINGRCQGKGFAQYATGLKRFGGAEGTWRDAEDGWLEGNPIANGSVDSAAGFEISLAGHDQETIYYWIALGESYRSVGDLNRWVLERGGAALLREIEEYWRNWLRQNEGGQMADLSPEIVELYYRSLLIIASQCDRDGAILAATDTDIMATARDHYCYLWPRDGALVAYALDRAGYPSLPLKFFELCSAILSDKGYYYQKYNPDGSIGSSWHPRIIDGRVRLPIQEDETALVVYALWQHYLIHRDRERLEPFRQLALRIGDFLSSYLDQESGLPLPSYDLWEERWGVFSFTTAAVAAGLEAAAGISRLFGDKKRQLRFLRAAALVRKGIGDYLYSHELGRFLRGLYPEGRGYRNDFTLDASLYGLFAFKAVAADDSRLVRTREAVRDGLLVRTKVGGIARYTGDWYFKVSEELSRVPGNPWPITTIWLGEWSAASAKTVQELEPARQALEWTARQAALGGILPEQIHPSTGRHLSVSPLTWSHSTFVLAVNNYLDHYRILSGSANR